MRVHGYISGSLRSPAFKSDKECCQDHPYINLYNIIVMNSYRLCQATQLRYYLKENSKESRLEDYQIATCGV
jgi:hypothetical protein